MRGIVKVVEKATGFFNNLLGLQGLAAPGALVGNQDVFRLIKAGQAGRGHDMAFQGSQEIGACPAGRLDTAVQGVEDKAILV